MAEKPLVVSPTDRVLCVRPTPPPVSPMSYPPRADRRGMRSGLPLISLLVSACTAFEPPLGIVDGEADLDHVQDASVISEHDAGDDASAPDAADPAAPDSSPSEDSGTGEDAAVDAGENEPVIPIPK